LKLAYLGTPALAVPPLRALVDAGYEIPLVVSRVDKRRGRGADVMPSPVKAAAQELGLPVTDHIDDLLEIDADLGVVVAYGRLIKPHILEALPMVNVHFSLLPRWRGAAPLERAILAGDERTGVALMEVVDELDAGAVYREAEVRIDEDATADELRAELVDVGTSLLLDALAEGLGEPTPQEGEVTYAQKIDPAELRLDWSQPAADLHRKVRVGGAWTTFRGKRLKVHRSQLGEPDEVLAAGEPSPRPEGVLVGTGEGTIELLEVQPEGKGRQAARAWANGARLEPGERLG
jgi:methionyl-tRNA formyltransferase